jgi:hypothetical protein
MLTGIVANLLPESLARINLVLTEFGLDQIWDEQVWDYDRSDNIRRAIQPMGDEGLAEMAAYLLPQFADFPSPDSIELPSLWHGEQVRLFISHPAARRADVEAVSEHLKQHGIDGFVAHTAIDIEAEWQAEIEKALRTMEAFVCLFFPESVDRPWIDQEIGWAFGRHVPFLGIRIGADIPGFPSRTQWPAHKPDEPAAVAKTIASWIRTKSQFQTRVFPSLLAALGAAPTYPAAAKVATEIAKLGTLDLDQLQKLKAIVAETPNVLASWRVRDELSPLFEKSELEYPGV